jgi:hypothetical protein
MLVNNLENASPACFGIKFIGDGVSIAYLESLYESTPHFVILPIFSFPDVDTSSLIGLNL